MNHLSNIFPAPTDIPDLWNLPDRIDQREYLVGGELRTWGGDQNDIISPIFINNNGVVEPKIIGSTPLLGADESMAALDAAVQAYNNGRGEWPTMTIVQRIGHVEQFLAAMRLVRTEVVRLLMWEIGKNLPDSEKEFDRTCIYIEDTIRELKDLNRRSARFEMEEGVIAQIRRVPIGVALCMGPYNYPLNETFTTLIPALIMGNTVVFKPAKFGVLLIQPLLAAFQQCFPPGVINVIYGKGRETVGVMMESGKLDLLAFIGTHKGANEIKKMHPKPHRLRSILGLDAKNPAVVLADADLEIAVAECVAGALSFNGQRCTALKILFVHTSLVDTFTAKFLAALEKLTPGMPWDPGVKLTPLPEPQKPAYLTELVADAQQYGAKIMNEGGGTVNHSFFYPAVLSPVNAQMRVYHEEQFGPLVPIVPFEKIEEPIAYVVNSNFGQQVSIFGKDPVVVGTLIDSFVNQVGRINLNAQSQRGPDAFPFNGRKDSAEGTLSVADALRAFSIRSMVATKDTPGNKAIVQSILKDHTSDFLTLDYIF
jgi:glyceraldehyde-3-phosphate dehydrogenase (NADP+)